MLADIALLEIPYLSCSVGSAPASRNSSGKADLAEVMRDAFRRATGSLQLLLPARRPRYDFRRPRSFSRACRHSRRMVATSSGLMVGICRTPTSTRSAASVPRFRARASSSVPIEMIRTSLPSAEQLRLAEFKSIAVLVKHERNVAAQQAHIDRTIMGGDRGNDLFNLVASQGSIIVMLRQPAEDREIFGRLMARPVAGGQARQRARRF